MIVGYKIVADVFEGALDKGSEPLRLEMDRALENVKGSCEVYANIDNPDVLVLYRACPIQGERPIHAG